MYGYSNGNTLECSRLGSVRVLGVAKIVSDCEKHAHVFRVGVCSVVEEQTNDVIAKAGDGFRLCGLHCPVYVPHGDHAPIYRYLSFSAAESNPGHAI